MMDHDRALEMLSGYLDQELGLSESLEFERHLADCEQCQKIYMEQCELSAQLKQAGMRVEAPRELVARIESALAPRRSLHERMNFRRWLGGGAVTWLPAGAVAMSMMALVASLGIYLVTPSGEQRLAQEIVDDHIRSLQVDHLFDVVSTDRHTVKPWFNGKLDFAPAVIDLAPQGYPLVGGRLDYLNGRSVAVMVYRYKLHPINLYVWPDQGAVTEPEMQERQGYHIAHWVEAGMHHWVVTDASDEELRTFVTQLRAHSAS
jgi:anti-sigma factor RsiW